MIDLKLIRDNPAFVKERVATKGFDASVIDAILPLDVAVQDLRRQVEAVRAERNQAATGPEAAVRGRELKRRLDELEAAFRTREAELQGLLATVPNLPADSVPVGTDESGNMVLRQWGERPRFDFAPKPHWELGEALGLIDNEQAAKVSGARFTYLKGKLALLQFALVQHAFRVLTSESSLAAIAAEAGLAVSPKPFLPVVPPVLIRPEVMQRMGRLEPRDERYHTAVDDLYLVGSAEHTLGPLHMDETLAESALPLRYAGYSTAFRREAGSYGKDTKGILRLHQFDKLELESFTVAEQGEAEQDFLVAIQEHLMRSLGLPYQVVSVCTGDMGGPDARQFDIETWMPGQDTYRETHTADLMGDYQARRLGTRVKREGGNQLVHMNDATAFAVGRTLIAIMENYQQADGSIRVPEALVPYCGFEEIAKP